MKIAVGFSGGVDSSIAVALLQKAGHDVLAVQFDQLGNGADPTAKAVAEKLGVPFAVLNLQKEFEKHVRTPFLKKLKEGKTPNPCILCNPTFKFGVFIKSIQKKFGIDTVATGHYCLIKDEQLMIPKDREQDQTYFLSGLSREQLKHIVFPLGHLTKHTVRKMAAHLNLPSAEKKTSTDVCFLQGERFEKFVEEHVPQKNGNIVELETGNVIGTHSGLSQFTPGQRKNIGVGGIKDRPEMPWFVIRKDGKTNELMVSQSQESLDCTKLTANNFNWIAGKPPAKELECEAKIRFRSPAVPCHVVVGKKEIQVTFKKSVHAVVAGQQVVLYDGDICLGGGEIK